MAAKGVRVRITLACTECKQRNYDVYNDEEKRKVVETSIPMGRFGKAEECAGMVLLLWCKNIISR